jgi:hypothetical protein
MGAPYIYDISHLRVKVLKYALHKTVTNTQTETAKSSDEIYSLHGLYVRKITTGHKKLLKCIACDNSCRS